MSLTPATNKQIPDHAILDFYNKQVYIGNQFMVSTNLVTIATAAVETPLLYLNNPSTNAHPQNISLFQDIKKLICAPTGTTINFANFKSYLNPTIVGAGTAITPQNQRSGSATTSVMAVAKSPTVTGVAQVQTIDTVADVAGSLNNTYFTLSDNLASHAEKLWYMWFNVNSAGTDPAIAGRTGIEVALATGATANAVATAMRSALNALTTDFVATGATNHVIITNVNTGASAPAADGAQPTGFTFHNTTPGSSAFGTFFSVMPVSLLEVDQSSLIILDPGSSMLITANVSANSTQVAAELSWYEL